MVPEGCVDSSSLLVEDRLGVRLLIYFKITHPALEVFYGISEGRYVGVLGCQVVGIFNHLLRQG